MESRRQALAIWNHHKARTDHLFPLLQGDSDKWSLPAICTEFCFESFAAPGDPHDVTITRAKKHFKIRTQPNQKGTYRASLENPQRLCTEHSICLCDHGLASVSACLYALLMRPKQKDITPNLMTHPRKLFPQNIGNLKGVY